MHRLLFGASWTRFWYALRAAVRPVRRDRDVDDELAFHLAEATAAYQAQGLSHDEARTAARRDFGSTLPVADACRDAWGVRLWTALLRDAQAGWRAACRAPGTTVAAVVTLALGIGASTAMFSVVDGVLLRPLPFAVPETLVRADQVQARGAFAVLRTSQQVFDDFGFVLMNAEYNVTVGATPERLRGTEVSASLLPTLGLTMFRGRHFTATEALAAQPASVIISHRLWLDRFAGRDDVLNQSLRVDGRAMAIVGVLPPGSLLPLPDADVWLPMSEASEDRVALWATNAYVMIGRLLPGRTAADATAEMRRLAPLVRDSYPWRMPDVFGASIRVAPLLDTVVHDARRRVLLLAGAVALLLLVACANVATLVLARAAVRDREFSVRAALGASRPRLAQQLLTESLLLWVAGGSLGLLVGWVGLDTLTAWLPPDIPRIDDLRLDPRAVAVGLAATLVTGVSFGLLPARRAARADLVGALRAHESLSSIGSRHPILRGLVVAQLACAVVLVSGTLLLTRTLWDLTNVAIGFDASDVVMARLTPDDGVCATSARCRALFDEIVGRADALPEVSIAALAGGMPLDRAAYGSYAIDVQDHPVAAGAPAFTAYRDVVSPGYFAALDIPLRRGRAFTVADTTSEDQVAIVSASFAHRFWPDGSAVGKRVRYVWQEQWRTIIGIVGDVRSDGPALSAPLTFYVPYGQEVPTAMTLLVEGPDIAAHASDLKALVQAVNRDVPVSRLQPAQALVEASLGGPAALARVLRVFGVAVVLLGAIGTYGVLSGSVVARRREFGIRLAIGASSRRVVGEVLGESLRLCVMALLIGLPCAWLGASRLGDVLHGASFSEAMVIGGVVLVMTLTALGAALVPAIRAARTSPVEAMRP